MLQKVCDDKVSKRSWREKKRQNVKFDILFFFLYDIYDLTPTFLS